jgi:hypothetical protein
MDMAIPPGCPGDAGIFYFVAAVDVIHCQPQPKDESQPREVTDAGV